MDRYNLEQHVRSLKLSTDAHTDEVVLGRLLNTYREKHPQPNSQSISLGVTIMHSKWTRLVAAAAAIVVVFLAIGHLGGERNVAFAEICRNVRQSKTLTYSIRSLVDGASALVGRVMEKDGICRTEFLGPHKPGGDVWILDRQQGKCLCLDNTRKVGHYLGAEIRSAEETSIYDTFRGFLERPVTAVKNLGMRQVDGRPAMGFQLTRQDSGIGLVEYTVWADPDTRLPILIECRVQSPRDGREIQQVITDITFDEPLDDSLFDFNPPGFTIETQEPDPRAGRMKCAVQMDAILKACRQYVNDHNGQWPDSLTDLTGYGIGPEALVNPRSAGDMGFVYLKPSRQVSESTVVLYEVYDTWLDGINVGFANFQVQFIDSEAEFKETLAK